MNWVFGFVLGWLALLMGANYLRTQQQVRLKEMAHAERVLAMEKGIPLTELPEDEELDMLTADMDRSTGNGSRLAWVRYGTLALGLLLVFFGLGWWVGFSSVSETASEGMNELATLGLIPTFSGVGLLLFYWMTREAKV